MHRSIHLLLAAVLLGCGVRDVHQDAGAVLVDRALPGANPEDGPAPESRRDEILVGAEAGHEVPVRVDWTVAKDRAGCLRVQRVALTRTGGPTTTEIYDAKVKPANDGQCMGADVPGLDGKQPELIDSVNVSYCWRWNGAANATACAYQGGFGIRADATRVEGVVRRPGK